MLQIKEALALRFSTILAAHVKQLNLERYIRRTSKTRSATSRRMKILPAHNCTFEKVYVSFCLFSNFKQNSGWREEACGFLCANPGHKLTHGQLQKQSSAVCVCFRT